jgi:hypothetical protein
VSTYLQNEGCKRRNAVRIGRHYHVHDDIFNIGQHLAQVIFQLPRFHPLATYFELMVLPAQMTQAAIWVEAGQVACLIEHRRTAIAYWYLFLDPGGR